jgi:dTDP-4-amino-4,6-dideoxygalactose transaminase
MLLCCTTPVKFANELCASACYPDGVLTFCPRRIEMKSRATSSPVPQPISSTFCPLANARAPIAHGPSRYRKWCAQGCKPAALPAASRECRCEGRPLRNDGKTWGYLVILLAQSPARVKLDRRFRKLPQEIPFNLPTVTGKEIELLRQVIEQRTLSGDGDFTKECEALLKRRLGVAHALMTHSCTAALEVAAILAGLEPGNEVIMPSFTFVSTANAVALRRAAPVFVDIRQDTLNIDEARVEAAVTPRTKAIIAVHYAGVCAEMDALNVIAKRHGLVVFEDAAQALLSTYRGKPAGALGDGACFSFHASKNIVSGEGGAFVTSRADFAERAAIIREKGTNRARFMLGLTDKYTWVDLGSSYIPSELVAAFLRAQLDEADAITADRLKTWNTYHTAFAKLEVSGGARRPVVPAHCAHNGHLYYLLMPEAARRDALIKFMATRGITAPFHYVPLHSSEAGRRFGRVAGTLDVTDRVSQRLIRLPMWFGMTDADCRKVIDCVLEFSASS